MMWWDIDVKELAGTMTAQPFFIYMEKIQSVMICSQEDLVTSFQINIIAAYRKT
jgi:hypothetical protein